MRDQAVELGYALAWRAIRTLPKPMAWALFRAVADRAARKNGPAARRLGRNLRRVVGPDVSEVELARLVRAGLRSYARYWLESFRLPSLSPRELEASFRLERHHLLGDAVAAGTGCVVALPHAGNWDVAGAWVAARGWPLTTVAERLKPEGVYQRFLAFRESLGMEIIPTVGGQRPPIDVLCERLGQARVVPLLADRDLSVRGVEVTFFGGRTRMPAGPALLALRTGAPLFTVSLWYEGDLACGRVDGPVPLPPANLGSLDVRVRALTQTIADRLAEGIAAHPTDWHMLQRLWLDDQASGLGDQVSNRPGAPSPASSSLAPPSAALPSSAHPSSATPPSPAPAVGSAQPQERRSSAMPRQASPRRPRHVAWPAG